MKSIYSRIENTSWVMRLVLVALIVCAGAVTAAGYDSVRAPVPVREQNPGQQAVKEIDIETFSFKPDELVVPAGTKITWINNDDTPHIVVSVDKHFTSSPALDTGDQYSYVFDKPGSYEYFCSLHPKMVGRVVVN